MREFRAKNWKKTAGLLLAITALGAVTACGTSGGSKPASASTNNSGSSSANTSSSSSNQSSSSTNNSSSNQTASASNVGKLNIKLAWYMPLGTATSEQGNEIAKKIESASNGAIQVSTYPGGSLLDEKSIGQGLQNNTVQMALMGMHWWSGQEPATEWDMIPGLEPADPNKLLPLLHGKVGQDVNKLVERHGVSIVGWGFYGYAGAYINNKHAIKEPEDMKGLKMRADGNVAAYEMQHFGATGINMSSDEVYQALQRGTISGATSGPSSFVSRKWIESAKYVTAIKQEYLIYPVFVNSKWWNGLTDAQRTVISKAVAATEEDNVNAINAEWTKDIKTMNNAGGKVTVITQNTNSNLYKDWMSKTSFMKDYYLKQAGSDGQQIVTDLGK